MNLTAIKTVQDLLQKHGLRADKRYGQNFLVDANYLKRIVDSVGFAPGETVYEVGPGLGTLTRALALSGAQVIAVEMDKRLAPVHAETLAGLNTQVVWADALSFDWQSLPAQSLFAGNLPYNIATPLITQLLLCGRFRQITVLVQKEVALRMVAEAGTPQYGILSLRIQYHARAKRLFDLPPGVFLPAPKVTSSVVQLLPGNSSDNPLLFKLIEAAFGQRRKTLSNALKACSYSPAAVLAALDTLALPHQIRGEALTLQQFIDLHQILKP
jgi:16S rRNA (adenine1518-N6/adenine1519-N6)-dimethyltransferase